MPHNKRQGLTLMQVPKPEDNLGIITEVALYAKRRPSSAAAQLDPSTPRRPPTFHHLRFYTRRRFCYPSLTSSTVYLKSRISMGTVYVRDAGLSILSILV